MRQTTLFEDDAFRTALGSKIDVRIRPHDHGYEWTMVEYLDHARRWDEIDAGSARTWYAALAEAARAIEYQAQLGY